MCASQGLKVDVEVWLYCIKYSVRLYMYVHTYFGVVLHVSIDIAALFYNKSSLSTSTASMIPEVVGVKKAMINKLTRSLLYCNYIM